MAKSKKNGVTYAWNYGQSVPGITAQQAGEELSRIEARDGGITPKAVVNEARPEDAVLHPAFTWDDEEAAEKYRQEVEARRIIRVQVVRASDDHTPPQRVPAFVSVALRETKQREYISTTTAMADDAYREMVLRDAMRQLEGLKKRYQHLHELAVIWEALESAKPVPVGE